ncbi:MAG: HigA family addiction module antitoxin, partial [Bacteroidota bacterium]
MARLNNIHPGEILREEFLVPLDLSGYRLAKETGMSPSRVRDILLEKRRITADTAARLAKFFGTTATWRSTSATLNRSTACS